MVSKEIKIPDRIRNYSKYGSLIGQEGCPRCESLDIKIKFTSFKKDDMSWSCTCNICGLYYSAKLAPEENMIIIDY
jgi:transcription elongation factor Elf1